MAVTPRPEPHAIKRARERYGLRLSTDDLRAIALACERGHGRLARLTGGSERHVVSIHGVTLVVIYRPNLRPSDLSRPHIGAGSIITILPREAALAGKDSVASRQKKTEGRHKKPNSIRKRRGF